MPDKVTHPPATTRLTVLRSFAVTIHGRTARLPHNAERVLAFLALCARVQTRSVVAGTLWTDLPEDRANATLRTTLWQIRRCVPGATQTFGGELALGAGVEVDLCESIRIIRSLETRDGCPTGLTDSLREDVLPDWPDEWIVVERERYRQLRLHALELLCRRLTSAGLMASAIEAGLAAVAGDPLREGAQRVLIEAHLAEGNLSEAVRQYRSFCELLDTALGLEPTVGLTDLLPARSRPHRVRDYLR